MNLKNIDDDTLLKDIDLLVRDERNLLVKVLHHLREIDRRKLFSTLKFGSLYEYATKRLGYSEDQAYRRISAMRLLREIPELEEKISSGSLSLTNLGLAQTFFKREQKSLNDKVSRSLKIEVLKKLEDKSKRDAEKVIINLSPETPFISEKVRTISNDRVEIKFTANYHLNEKIKVIKGLLAHSHPHITLEELFDKLCDIGVEKLTAPARIERKGSTASLLRKVRAKGECENCGSRHGLEIDHIKPLGFGGASPF
jgi:hypothetical protein